MTVTLVTFGKSGERRDFGLEKKSTVIGRKTDADLRIPLSQISRAHCEVTLNGRGAILRDLGSSNGTYVNDERIEDETVLDAGDRVRIGPIQFLVQIDGEPAKITPDMLAAPTPPDTKPVPLPTSGKRAPANAATEAGSKSTSDDIEDLDIDALDDLDLDDLSDIDFNEEGSGGLEALDELDELGEDDLIVDEDDEK